MVTNNISWVVGGAVSASLSADSSPVLDQTAEVLTEKNTNITDYFEVGSVYKFGKYRDCLVLGKSKTAITVEGVKNKKVREIDLKELVNYIPKD